MRAKTNGKFPRWVIWENVPGALSSSAGNDFYEVLRGFCSCAGYTDELPRPAQNKKTGRLEWRNAGSIVGDNFSVAWRIANSKYFGVPQRRRRIFLVLDLTGDRAGKILFEREGQPWHFEQGRASKQTYAAAPVGSLDRSARAQGGGVLSIRERAGKPGGGKGLLIGEDAAFTIATVPNSFVCYDCRGNGDGHTVPTLTGDHQNRVTDYTACVVYESHPQDSRIKAVGDVSPTVTVKWAKGTADTPLVVKESNSRLPVLETMQSFGEYKELGVASG